MPAINKYISILSPPLKTGTLTLTVKSFDLATPISFNVNISIPSIDITEKQLAQAIAAGLTAGFTTNNALYSGIPSFTQNGVPPFTLRCWLIDHIVDVFCQVPFWIEVPTTDVTGIAMVIDEIPVYPTIKEAVDLAQILGTELAMADGTPYTDSQKITVLRAASQELIGYMCGSPMIATQFLHQERGFGNDGCSLENYPVIANDQPVIRGPGRIGVVGSNDALITSDYDIDFENGILSFSSSGFMPFLDRPLDFDNLMAMTYVAGMTSIHPVLKQETVRVAGFIGQPLHIESLKGGSSSIKFRNREDVQALIQSNLNRIMGR